MSKNIGELAGLIWHYLNNNGEKPASLTKVAKGVDLKKDDVALGVGWLAKEGQINFEEKGSTLKVSLVK